MTFSEINTAAFLAYKSVIRGSRSTASVIIFIIALSYLNILFISGMLFGLQKLITQSVIDLFSSHVTVSAQEAPRIRTFIDHQDDIRAQIESIDGVIATSRHYLLAGSIGFDKFKNGEYKHISGAIVAIDPDQEKHVLSIDRHLLDGEWLEPTDRDKIILSSALAGGYGLFAPNDLGGARVGDTVRITFSNGVTRQYDVKGIYNDAIGLFETFLTDHEAESILSAHNQASQILVKIETGHTSIDSVAREISRIAPQLKVQPYTVLLGSFAAFLSALDLIAAIVSAISVLVAAITMFALVYVNAIHKRRQIAILKAIGIKQEIIILAYVFQSLFYSLCGAALGAVFVFHGLTPYLTVHPIDVVFGSLTLEHQTSTSWAGVASLIGAGFFAGLIPSWMVAKNKILESFR